MESGAPNMYLSLADYMKDEKGKTGIHNFG
jgi:hypothetical protein